MYLPEDFIDGFFSGVIAIALMHGILLASIFLFHNRLSTKSNKFLALSIFGICVILAFEFMFWLDLEEELPDIILYLPIYIRTSIPVGIFYFVLFLIQPNIRLSNFEKMGFAFIGLEVVLECMYLPVNLFMEDSEKILNIEYSIIIIGWSLSILAAILFLPRALFKVIRYQKLLYDNYSTTSDKSLAWVRNFLILVIFILLFLTLSFVQYVLGYEEASELSFVIVTIGLVVILFWVGYSIILKYNWFQIVPFEEEKVINKPYGNKLSSKTNTYHQNLLKILEEEKLYENPELTLDDLAECLQISSGYLSQIINEKQEKNFFEFINSYRVEAVKQKLLDEQYSNYTIMGIALESGFKSKSTFNSVFKKIEGYTPSSFKKLHSKQK